MFVSNSSRVAAPLTNLDLVPFLPRDAGLSGLGQEDGGGYDSFYGVPDTFFTGEDFFGSGSGYTGGSSGSDWASLIPLIGSTFASTYKAVNDPGLPAPPASSETGTASESGSYSSGAAPPTAPASGLGGIPTPYLIGGGVLVALMVVMAGRR